MKKTNNEGSLNEGSEYNASSDEENKNILEFKVVLLGDSGVGKTCILHRLVENTFEESQLSTIVVDFRTKEVTIGEQTINVRIWDSPGQDKFKSITKTLYANTQLFILVYSVTDKDSFESLGDWLEEIKNANSNAKFLLVGNKIDVSKERKVTNDEGRNFANEHNMEFFEVSAKKGTNISDGFFTSLIKKFLEEEKKKKDFLSTGSKRDVASISLKSSFCDECCSCCPCFKSSEDNL
jgi:small GTP-binding protein